ncbi:hypothetical protein CDAR_113171 [Caerostris darwini]|uniref:Uncharacterized protein n=1 Tax=Caerostris darwini TaxID=1538125 RepID=A0AAV4PZ79_9ARAC|nr:hypothetical protein CDAR_113171 [Caerostris darwini]
MPPVKSIVLNYGRNRSRNRKYSREDEFETIDPAAEPSSEQGYCIRGETLVLKKRGIGKNTDVHSIFVKQPALCFSIKEDG